MIASTYPDGIDEFVGRDPIGNRLMAEYALQLDLRLDADDDTG
jgi:hypothetical protein